MDRAAVYFFVAALALLALAVLVHLYAPRIRARYIKLRGRDYGRPMFRPGSVYLVTVERPYGQVSLILRRSTAFGYVGQTRQRDYMIRINQHINGSWDHPPQWWAGHVVRVRCVYHSKHVTTWGLDFREWLVIKITFPLHNYKMNLTNPRRVTPPPEVLEELKRRKIARAQQPRDYTYDQVVNALGDALQPTFRRPDGRPGRGTASRNRAVGTSRRPGTRSSKKPRQ